MIRIVRVNRTLLPIEKELIVQVQEIFRQNFSAVADYADKIPDLLENPIAYGYTAGLLVSEASLGRVTGFSLMLYFPTIRSGLLDFMAVNRDIHGGGTGSALYEATREYAKQAGALAQAQKFAPMFLVLCVEFDIMKGDPTGSFGLNGATMKQIGQAVGGLNVPTLAVQEGGYSLRNLRTGAAALFNGFAEALKPNTKQNCNGRTNNGTSSRVGI